MIANNYNQTVKAVHTNFNERRAVALLARLEKATAELTETGKKSNRVNRRLQPEMVANITSGSNLYGALLYNMEKVGQGQAQIVTGNRIFDSPATGRPDMQNFE